MNVLKYRKGKYKKLKRIQTKVFKTWVIKMAFSHFYLNPLPCSFSISPVWGGSESEIYGTIRAARLLKQMILGCTREVEHADMVAKIQTAMVVRCPE
jgi:hypothetical protein